MGPIAKPKRNTAMGRRLTIDETPNSFCIFPVTAAAALEHIVIQAV